MHPKVRQTTQILPTVALIGRVNVGKSTLFNRLIEEHKALVSDTPGTTRTSNEGIVLWRGKQFKLVDTGGLRFEDDVPLEKDIIAQSERAMKLADIVVFVTDGQAGVLPQEKELAKRLRRIEVKPVLLVANKVDTTKIEKQLTEPEWYKLGLGEPIPVSASNSRNVGDFLDQLYYLLEEGERKPQPVPEETETIRISVIGKPNVGKSSLFNKLIGEEKVIVSDMPHTTREPHDTLVEYTAGAGENEHTYTINFIDTAGLRRKSKVSGTLERQGIQKTIEILEQSDLVLFVLDGAESISSQDRQLGGLLERRSKSVIILLNKWDLAEDQSQTKRNESVQQIYSHFPHLDFAPVVFVSGKTGYRVHDIFPMIVRLWHARHTSIPNKALEVFLKHVMATHAPARGKGTRHPKLLGLHQINVAPPIFELFIQYRTSLHTSYARFLENKLREQFDFTGTPIVIKLRKMKK